MIWDVMCHNMNTFIEPAKKDVLRRHLDPTWALGVKHWVVSMGSLKYAKRADNNC